MTFPALFTAYAAVVVLAAAGVAASWLSGRARLATISLLAVWVAFAAILGATYPDVFAAMGVHSGLPLGAARDVMSAFAAMRKGNASAKQRREQYPIPAIVFHSDSDATVHPNNGQAVVAASVHALLAPKVAAGRVSGGRAYTRTTYGEPGGAIPLEHWTVHGAPHAWSGGNAAGSFTDPLGPDATAEMIRFFFAHERPLQRGNRIAQPAIYERGS